MLDFFRQQQEARRRTRQLVVLYLLAVALVVLFATGVVFGMMLLFGAADLHTPSFLTRTNVLVLSGSALFSAALVCIAGLHRRSQLRAGGRAVAHELSARRIEPNSTDADERRLLNIVEEMALASASPVPPVYVLDDEDAINAFAAGYGPSDSIIGVTRGTLKRLTRPQLQGVIAHEFSHILSGDVRLNMRLVAMLFGINAVALVGAMLIEVAARSRSSGKDSARGRLILLAGGSLLWLIGSVGALAAGMIKAAVSRQREFLADAAAVQFTRDPETIGGALRVIGGTIGAGRLETSHAEECSHMFFSEISTDWMARAFATHPALKERVRRVLPAWDGTWLKAPPPPSRDLDRIHPITGQRYFQLGAEPIALVPPPIIAERVALSKPDVFAQIDKARQMIDGLDRSLVWAARDAHDARALLLAMLRPSRSDEYAAWSDAIAGILGAPVVKQATELAAALDRSGPEARLPLIDLTLGPLAAMSPSQYQSLRQAVQVAMHLDGHVDSFEWALRRIMVANLDRRFDKAEPPRARYYATSGLFDECSVVLSFLIWIGTPDPEKAAVVLTAASKALRVGPLSLVPQNEATVERLDDALSRIELGTPAVRRSIVAAAARAVGRDGTITPAEAEVLRAIADSVRIPLTSIVAHARS